MNIKVVIVVIAVLALLGVGGYMYMKKAPAVQQEVATTEPTPTTSAMQSLKDLLAGGTSMKCTFSTDTGSTKSSGTIYTGSGKYKADIDTTVDGKVSQMHMINDGQFSFIWGSAMPTGIKIKIDTTAVEDGSTAGSNQYFDPNSKANYNCAPTVMTAGSFVAPTDVKFTDLSAQMKVPAQPAY